MHQRRATDQTQQQQQQQRTAYDQGRAHATPLRTAARPLSAPRQPAAETLSRWLLAEEQRAYNDQLRISRLFELMDTNAFAQLWYAARDAGELLRARALQALYTQRTTPGGAHPDPRQPAAFSSQAILSTAARLLGASIWQVPEYLAAQTDQLALSVTPTNTPPTATPTTAGRSTLAWLTTYPNGRPPDVAVRMTMRHRQQEHDVACLLGYLCREHTRINDPDSPAGMILLPSDPGLVTVLHQFAIGLLGLPVECPEEWRCPCNQIRRRYNAPPPDHQQATDAFNVTELRREVTRQTRDTRRLDETSTLAPDALNLLDRIANGERPFASERERERGSDPHHTNPEVSAAGTGPLPRRRPDDRPH